MKIINKVIGLLLWIGAGIWMFIFGLSVVNKWFRTLDITLAIFLSPLLVPLGIFAFPFIFWVVENIFPTFYFILWGIGLSGLVMVSVLNK